MLVCINNPSIKEGRVLVCINNSSIKGGRVLVSINNSLQRKEGVSLY